MSENIESQTTFQEELINKRHFWQAVVNKWQENPAKPRDFCNENNLNIDQFYYWRRKFLYDKETEVNTDYGFTELIPSSTNNNKINLNIKLGNNLTVEINSNISQIGEIINQLGVSRC